MKNWKSTVCGLISGIATAIVLTPDCCSPDVHKLAVFIAAGGLAGLGISAKDATTHSTLDQVTKADKPTE